MEETRYYGTICWDGYLDQGDGSYTTVAEDVDSLLEGIELSLEEFKGRGAYFECASIESNVFDNRYQEITDQIRSELKQRRTNEKRSL